jgi:two-component system nitrogen regulation response regulator GlnG/two-component system response regulator HydG
LGEGLQPWLLRDALARAVASRTHILLLGPSGAGKELAARWIHHLATRAHAGQRKRLIACNAATLTGNLIDAELFGNAKNYPNAGMAERAGLVGEADGGVLFLDEIAELSEELQARLLRVLDSGEYLRLGESQPRTAKFRLVGATNRPESSLKGDVLARFESRCQVSGLNERRSDIGLLIAHFLVEMAQQSPQFARFLEPATLGTRVRVAPALVTALTRHKYQFHVRELRRLLRIALANSDGDFVAFSKEVEEELVQSAPVDQPNKSTNELSVQEIQDQLTVAAGNVTEAAKRLGLKNRFVLLRLMKKLGIR